MYSKYSWLALGVTLLAASGCFSPEYTEGIACSEQGRCPPGMECGPDGRCWPPGHACTTGSDCPSEICDTATGTCAAPRCGDGVVNQPGEQCDEGGPTATCTADCMPTDCGNGVVDPGEQCDDGGESATCNADCTPAACGDGTVNASAGEQCDDGNTSDNDDCLATCLTPSCGDGFVWNLGSATEECDEGGVDTATCDADCTAVLCGDSYTNTVVEQCDEGGVDTATCDADCTAVVCGDSYANTVAGEECDDGGIDTSTCDSDCTTPVCGDGHLNTATGEQCDDGNATDGDGCSSICTITSSYLVPGRTDIVATLDMWSVRCLAWSGNVCTRAQMRMDCSVCGIYDACGVWHDITVFNNGDRRTSLNFCAIAAGDASVALEGSGGSSMAPRGCGWGATTHPICETGRATYHAAGFGFSTSYGLHLNESYCAGGPALLTIECTAW